MDIARATDKAAKVLEKAESVATDSPGAARVLVDVADAWLRLSSSLRDTAATTGERDDRQHP